MDMSIKENLREVIDEASNKFGYDIETTQRGEAGVLLSASA